jgi:hypothetical protein
MASKDTPGNYEKVVEYILKGYFTFTDPDSLETRRIPLEVQKTQDPPRSTNNSLCIRISLFS